MLDTKRFGFNFYRPLFIIALTLGCIITTSAQQPKFAWVKPTVAATQIVVNDVLRDSSGNVYTVGKFTGKPDFEPSGIKTLTLKSKGETNDIFISKHNKSGDLLWVKEISDSGDNIAYSICSDSQNDIYITGVFTKSADFNPGSGEFRLKSKGEYNIFVLKLNAAGSFI